MMLVDNNDDDDGGDVICTAFQQLLKGTIPTHASPNNDMLVGGFSSGGGGEDVIAALLGNNKNNLMDESNNKTTQSQRQGMVYTKDFLQAGFSMGSTFAGPLILHPKPPKEDHHSKKKTKESAEAYEQDYLTFMTVKERLASLIRQQSRKPYLTPKDLAQLYQNVFGESLSPTKNWMCGQNWSIHCLAACNSDVRVELYPLTNNTTTEGKEQDQIKIFYWEPEHWRRI